MITHSSQVIVSKAVGAVSIEIIEPAQTRAVMTLGHGAGTDMHHHFMRDLSLGLAAHNICSIRFNFPYTEQKRKMPDRFPVASATIMAVLEDAHRRYPQFPLFGGGKSFGGRMTSQTLAAQPPGYVKGVVFYGFPLHTANKPSVDRAVHLKEVGLPLLFLQGTRDALAHTELIEEVCRTLPQTTLIKIEGVDHGFVKGKQNHIPLLCKHTVDWLDRII